MMKYDKWKEMLKATKRELTAMEVTDAFSMAIAQEVDSIAEAASPATAIGIMMACAMIQKNAIEVLFPELKNEKASAATETNSEGITT